VKFASLVTSSISRGKQRRKARKEGIFVGFSRTGQVADRKKAKPRRAEMGLWPRNGMQEPGLEPISLCG